MLRSACRLVGDGSFDIAAQRLDELCGIPVSGETLRRRCSAEAEAMKRWVRTQPAAAAPFREAEGEVEVQTDAGKVNTTAGWRDWKLIAFAKRPLGPAADPSEWADRERPGPTAQVAFADIEGIETFRSDWRAWADRRGIGSGSELTVLGDGAEWIWNAASVQFPGCRQVLDVFHAPEHVGAAAKAMHGEGTDAAAVSFESGRAK
ncbi:MAG: ISLre2 family transposase, partial [Planctomycetes bacterium]|nr:ISLre2 family transposase [Planctomycetota bacterium]